MKLRIAGIVNDSITDGPGLRLCVFAQGCPHNCPGCHNPETHDITGGYETETAEILAALDKNPLLDGVTFSGGEPFLQPEAFAGLAEAVKQRGLSLIVYTGYTWEELLKMPEAMRLVRLSDYIVDGKFDESLKSLDLSFMGSKNQRLINVKEALG